MRNCRLEDVGIAVNAQYAGSQDFYITDNVMLGRDDRYRLLGWYNPGIYGGNRLKSYHAVKVYGSGHVVSHNYIAFFHDGIDVCTHGSPDPEEDRRAASNRPPHRGRARSSSGFARHSEDAIGWNHESRGKQDEQFDGRIPAPLSGTRSRKYKTVLQVGTQPRSMEMDQMACKLVRTGGLGKLKSGARFRHPHSAACAPVS